MKKIYKVLSTLLLVFMCMLCVNTTDAFAEKVKGKEFSLSSGEKIEIEFKTTRAAYIGFDFRLTEEWNSEINGTNKLTYVLDRIDGTKQRIQQESIRVENLTTDDFMSWYDYTAKKVPAGTYRFTIRNNSAVYDYHLKWRIFSYDGISKTSTGIPKTVSVNSGKYKEYTFYPANRAYGLAPYEIVSSNPKVAGIYGTFLSDHTTLRVWGINPGKCTFYLKLNGVTKYKIAITVNPGTPVLQYTSIHHWVRGQKVKNDLMNVTGETWYSTNTKVATVSSTGVVTMVNPGKCSVIATYKGKKYECKVQVSRIWPNYFANVTAYKTRDNYFVVKFKNPGKYKITINSGIKVENDDYKSFDRDIYLKKPVTILPGETKYVPFYVKGTNTWYDESDYTLFYNFTYAGVSYEGHVWTENSVFKIGTGWYNTYWDEDDYIEWLW